MENISLLNKEQARERTNNIMFSGDLVSETCHREIKCEESHGTNDGSYVNISPIKDGQTKFSHPVFDVFGISRCPLVSGQFYAMIFSGALTKCLRALMRVKFEGVMKQLEMAREFNVADTAMAKADLYVKQRNQVGAKQKLNNVEISHPEMTKQKPNVEIPSSLSAKEDLKLEISQTLSTKQKVDFDETTCFAVTKQERDITGIQHQTLRKETTSVIGVSQLAAASRVLSLIESPQRSANLHEQAFGAMIYPGVPKSELDAHKITHSCAVTLEHKNERIITIYEALSQKLQIKVRSYEALTGGLNKKVNTGDIIYSGTANQQLNISEITNSGFLDQQLCSDINTGGVNSQLDIGEIIHSPTAIAANSHMDCDEITQSAAADSQMSIDETLHSAAALATSQMNIDEIIHSAAALATSQLNVDEIIHTEATQLQPDIDEDTHSPTHSQSDFCQFTQSAAAKNSQSDAYEFTHSTAAENAQLDTDEMTDSTAAANSQLDVGEITQSTAAENAQLNIDEMTDSTAAANSQLDVGEITQSTAAANPQLDVGEILQSTAAANSQLNIDEITHPTAAPNSQPGVDEITLSVTRNPQPNLDEIKLPATIKRELHIHESKGLDIWKQKLNTASMKQNTVKDTNSENTKQEKTVCIDSLKEEFKVTPSTYKALPENAATKTCKDTDIRMRQHQPNRGTNGPQMQITKGTIKQRKFPSDFTETYPRSGAKMRNEKYGNASKVPPQDSECASSSGKQPGLKQKQPTVLPRNPKPRNLSWSSKSKLTRVNMTRPTNVTEPRCQSQYTCSRQDEGRKTWTKVAREGPKRHSGASVEVVSVPSRAVSYRVVSSWQKDYN